MDTQDCLFCLGPPITQGGNSIPPTEQKVNNISLPFFKVDLNNTSFKVVASLLIIMDAKVGPMLPQSSLLSDSSTSTRV